jgi:hypothetical protein
MFVVKKPHVPRVSHKPCTPALLWQHVTNRPCYDSEPGAAPRQERLDSERGRHRHEGAQHGESSAREHVRTWLTRSSFDMLRTRNHETVCESPEAAATNDHVASFPGESSRSGRTHVVSTELLDIAHCLSLSLSVHSYACILN